MGFLKDFFATALKEGKEVSSLSSFEELSEDQLETHLSVDKYGEFQLTDAVRPSYDLKVVPRQGYRHEVYREDSSPEGVPVVMASVSKERLFDVFMDLLDPLGNTVDVVLPQSVPAQVNGENHLTTSDLTLNESDFSGAGHGGDASRPD